MHNNIRFQIYSGSSDSMDHGCTLDEVLDTFCVSGSDEESELRGKLEALKNNEEMEMTPNGCIEITRTDGAESRFTGGGR